VALGIALTEGIEANRAAGKSHDDAARIAIVSECLKTNRDGA
jgi:hypothetical protein